MNIALIQMSAKNSKESTIKETVKKIEEASIKSELIILQELHQDIYFCISEDVKHFEKAKYFNDDVLFWSNIAKKNKIVLVTSLFEQRAVGIYHNTAVVFDSDGRVAGKYRKMHIPDDPGFYEKFYFTPGDLGFEPIDTSVGRLGVLICWDQWYPEAARLMALKGAEILIYPTAIGWFDQDTKEEKQRELESWITVQRSHAIANGLPVVVVNRVGFEADKAIDGIRFWGNSFVAGVQGEILAQANEVKDEIIYANIDKKRVKEVRDNWSFFRDRRIECYGNLNKRYID
jgi:N-carbamoylputrescine amidase